MKILRIMTVTAFAVLLLIPIVFFNFTPDSVSEIDNRKLAEDPFTAEGDFSENFENYINDRLGFRSGMITAYTVLNDRLFGKMVHPIYEYGKDGYVFGSGISTTEYFGEYHIAFADMVKSIQDYCDERGVPFLFVFEPAKPAIYTDKLADGINYDREWVDLFFSELDKRGVNYLDNTETLRRAREEGVEVFNRKYDANHWNDLGAFYGTQKILERLSSVFPSLHVNQLSEFELTEGHVDSLPVSKFPIDEFIPIIAEKAVYSDISSEYSGIYLDSNYDYFAYYVNQDRIGSGTPHTLMFQGSYMNGYGSKFMINALGEYISVHDYCNVIDFPYYFNIFQPECVVFEVAEYTFGEGYFSLEKMQEINYNPVLSLPADDESAADPGTAEKAEGVNIALEKHGELIDIVWETDEVYSHVWVSADRVYDMFPFDGGYYATVKADDLGALSEKLDIYTSDDPDDSIWDDTWDDGSWDDTTDDTSSARDTRR